MTVLNQRCRCRGTISATGFFANNTAGSNPPVQTLGGQSILTLVGNWIFPGYSDLALVNTNLVSEAISFWRMLTPTTKQLLIMLRGGRVGIGTIDPTEALDVVGRVRTSGLVATGNAPTVAAQTGLGTGGSAQIIGGSTDQAGRVRMSTGASAVNGNAAMATITFNQAFDAAPRFVQLSPRNQAACRETAKFYVDGMSTTQAVIYGSNGGNPSVSSVFDFDYFIIK